MSTPLVSDGTYKIYNAKHTDSVVNLPGGFPYAGLTGFSSSSSSVNLKWKVKNIGNNQITIESVAAPGFYASAPIYLYAVSLTSSLNPTIWSVVNTGDGNFRISTASNGTEYFWFLPGNADHVTIMLHSGSDGYDGRWLFKSA